MGHPCGLEYLGRQHQWHAVRTFGYSFVIVLKVLGFIVLEDFLGNHKDESYPDVIGAFELLAENKVVLYVGACESQKPERHAGKLCVHRFLDVLPQVEVEGARELQEVQGVQAEVTADVAHAVRTGLQTVELRNGMCSGGTEYYTDTLPDNPGGQEKSI